MCTSVEAVMSSVALQETQPLLVSRTQAVTELAVEWTTAMHFLHKASWKSNCCVSTRIQKLCSIASFIAISRQDRHLLLASNIVVSKVSCIKCMGHAGAKERNLRCNRQPRTATKAETLMINKNRLRILLYHNMRALPHESSHLPF